MSKGIIKFESRDDKISMMEYILRTLDNKNINYTVTRKDELHIIDAEVDSDIYLFTDIMKRAERRGYENFVD